MEVSSCERCQDVNTDAFGIHRLMFGSDCPVSLLAASYGESRDIVEQYFLKFSNEEQDKLWGQNT